MTWTLRPYQQRALNLCRQAISQGHKNILLQGPTGSGKSLVIFEIIRSAFEKGKTVRFFVHRKKLLYQIASYLDSALIPYGLIKAGHKHEDWHNIQLGSIQTAHRRLEMPYMTPGDIVVIDEAHQSVSETYLKVIEKTRKNILIGLTATPVRKNGNPLKTLYTVLIQGKQYGGDIPELTAQGSLVPIRYHAPVEPDLTGIPITGGDYNLKVLESRLLQGKVLDDIVPNWFKYSEHRQTFVFATGIKHSIAIRDMFLKAGVPAEHVDGNVEEDEQNAILDRFTKGITKIICSCDIFIEGIDVSIIGCVFLARSTKSLRIYLQQIGRGMRPCPGKKDMILIDHSGTFAEFGFVHQLPEWNLNQKIYSTAVSARKARNSKPIDCPVCGNIYTGALRCPVCMNIPTKAQYARDISYIDGILGEIVYNGGVKVHVPTTAEKKDWYQQAKNYGWSKGKDHKWLAGMFKACFGSFPPWSFQNLPIKETSAEVSSYLDKKRQDFARRKSYAQAKNKGATP